MPPTDLSRLNQAELLATIKAGGFNISSSQLSEFLNMGDVAEQLGVEKAGNSKLFLPNTASVLLEFLPVFRSQKQVGWEQAPNYLRAWLRPNHGGLVDTRQNGLAISESLVIRERANSLATSDNSDVRGEDNLAKLVQIAEAQGRAQGIAMTEEVLTAEEAAAFLKISVGMLKKCGPAPFARYGKSARGDRWKRSQLL